MNAMQEAVRRCRAELNDIERDIDAGLLATAAVFARDLVAEAEALREAIRREHGIGIGERA